MNVKGEEKNKSGHWYLMIFDVKDLSLSVLDSMNFRHSEEEEVVRNYFATEMNLEVFIYLFVSFYC